MVTEEKITEKILLWTLTLKYIIQVDNNWNATCYIIL